MASTQFANPTTSAGWVRRLEVVPPSDSDNNSVNRGFGPIIGSSAAMQRLYPLCERLALSSIPVVIEGEIGTGKSLLAEALHSRGARKQGPLLTLDSASAGSHAGKYLFDGHDGQRSLVEQACGGTLVLEEVTELTDDAQARLVHFLERQDRDPRLDVRIIATSRRPIDDAVASGRFRKELFFRLAVSQLRLPPLRERGADVEALARTFWKTLAAHPTPFPPSFPEAYANHRWSGNVRELRNLIARRLELGPFADCCASDHTERPLGDAIEDVLLLNLPLSESREHVLRAFEARYVARVLQRNGGNVTRAAAQSGVARRYFQLLRKRTTESESTPPATAVNVAT